MNVLEKILEEIIDELKEEGIITDDVRGNLAVEIIRSHMDEGFNISVTQWIPYTVENMPKKEGLYLVTCDGEKYPVKRMRFKNGIWLWNYGIYDGKILAWQPLPEPYKPEEGQLCQR